MLKRYKLEGLKRMDFHIMRATVSLGVSRSILLVFKAVVHIFPLVYRIGR